jgi:membrane protease YdiL (CAAX protease family)
MKSFLTAFLQVMGYLCAIFLIMVLLVIPSQLMLGDLDSLEPRLQILLLAVHILFAVAVVSAVMAFRGKSSLVKSGWPGIGLSIRWFGVGTLIGFSISGGMLLITWLSGGGRFSFDPDRLSEYFQYVLPLVIFLWIAALGEEWIFRGYPLTKFSQTIGSGWANILVSLLFVAGHWGGSGWSILPATNIFIFSLVNGAMRFTAGGIPAAWGFHFAWNSLQVLAGATLTGENFQVPFVQFLSDEPVWLSGGAYGPEGGLGTSLATLVGLLLIGRYLQRQTLRDVSGKSTGSAHRI